MERGCPSRTGDPPFRFSALVPLCGISVFGLRVSDFTPIHSVERNSFRSLAKPCKIGKAFNKVW
jgi:hypothetical protein